MIKANDTWSEVREKQKELKVLLEESWKNGEYHVAAIGENVLRTVDDSLSASERTIGITNRFMSSIEKLEGLIQQHYEKLNIR